jgi:DNA-binding protein YbaB
MFDKLKQVREMQKQAKEVQKTLADEIITATNGDVEIKLDGNMEVKSVNIQNIENKESLEKDLKNAVNDGIKKAQKVMAQKMMGGGMNIPGF